MQHHDPGAALADGLEEADPHDTDRILAAAAGTLDLSRPTALVLSGTLGHVGDHAEARSVADRLMAGLPSGSHLSVNDGSRGTDPEYERAQDACDGTGAVPYFLRPVENIEGFFAGLEPVPPGVVPVPLWRPEPAAEGAAGAPRPIGRHGGPGRKP